jgi:hypothetical protein
VIVLESKRDPRGRAGAYTLAVFEGVDPDALVKRGAFFAGQPVVLSDGRVVGRVLSNGRAPAAFRAAGRSFPMETPVIEILWNDADFAKTAEQADLLVSEGKILLLGDERQPTRKASGRGWGRALAIGRPSKITFGI